GRGRTGGGQCVREGGGLQLNPDNLALRAALRQKMQPTFEGLVARSAAHEQHPVLQMGARPLDIKSADADSPFGPRRHELLVERDSVVSPTELLLGSAQAGFQPPTRAFLNAVATF